MVLIKKYFRGLFVFIISLFFFSLAPPAQGQNTVSFAGEITRLEALINNTIGAEQYNALMALARLHQLSGNTDAQLETLERVLASFNGSGTALAEKGRLFISIGEFERASAVAAVLLSRGQEYLLIGRYLLAQIEAFRSGNTRLLAALANDPDFSAHRSGIFFTIWRLSDDQHYRDRLTAEFPQSPEARIAANAAPSSPTPLWLLFPGRDSIRLAEPSPQVAIIAPVQGAAAPPATVVTPAVQAGTPQGLQLQTGVFGREDNARGMAERLSRAGFQPLVSRRHVNGNDLWAVTVPGGNDVNATTQRLRSAGFESFPVR